MKLCECGCGLPTPIAKKTDSRTGAVKGEPRKRLKGHGRKVERFIVEDRGYLTPCWVWQLYLNHGGYGQVHVPSEGRRLAHRVYYEVMHGPVPEGLELDHLCRVRACVNPDHLEPVTRSEHVRRSEAFARDTCKHGHPRTPENVYITKAGYRKCRVCHRLEERRRVTLGRDT